MDRNMLLGTFLLSVRCVRAWPLMMIVLRVLLYDNSFGTMNFWRFKHFSPMIFQSVRVAS
jgi:hypothetical protein